ncbi:DUF6538 domain-containing protein [Methylobacterium sp. WL19]|uniref:DUF6538 domain-containing protein n=1 Tax=Methylobacterium sp. WL19 TaxID=2603896 RepID=UPI00164FF9F0|nr:DUF6538 domain-containing protein [Methylobacterium sp. WL19]
MAVSSKMKRYVGRKDSSVAQFQTRVPLDLVSRMKGRKLTLTLPASGREPEEMALVTAGSHIKFSLQTRDGETAEVRRKAVRAELARIFDGARRGPAPISQKQIAALAGAVYRELVAQNDENPGSVEEWESFKALTRASLEGRIPNAPPISFRNRSDDETMAAILFGEDATAGVNSLERSDDFTALQNRVGRLTAWTLDRHGVEVEPSRQLDLMREVAKAALDAAWSLKARSRGDWRPDPTAERFPAFQGETVKPAADGPTFDDAYARWIENENPRYGSRRNRKTATDAFVGFTGKSRLADVTPDDVLRWRSSLMASDLAPGSIATRVSDLRAALNYAVSLRLITASPTAGLKLTIKANRLTQHRDGMRGYSDSEVAQILAQTAKASDPRVRWLPLLAAGTGGRVSDVAQLWAERVRQIDGVWVFAFQKTEDNGGVKTPGSARMVPIHPRLIEAGFLDFVRKMGAGPLFYRNQGVIGSDKVHPYKVAADHVGKHIRKLGFNDPTKAPNHGFRHWFKTVSYQIGLDSVTVDYIQGHKTAGEAARYRHVGADLRLLAKAVGRIPVPPFVHEPKATTHSLTIASNPHNAG